MSAHPDAGSAQSPARITVARHDVLLDIIRLGIIEGVLFCLTEPATQRMS